MPFNKELEVRGAMPNMDLHEVAQRHGYALRHASKDKSGLGRKFGYDSYTYIHPGTQRRITTLSGGDTWYHRVPVTMGGRRGRKGTEYELVGHHSGGGGGAKKLEEHLSTGKVMGIQHPYNNFLEKYGKAEKSLGILEFIKGHAERVAGAKILAERGATEGERSAARAALGRMEGRTESPKAAGPGSGGSSLLRKFQKVATGHGYKMMDDDPDFIMRDHYYRHPETKHELGVTSQGNWFHGPYGSGEMHFARAPHNTPEGLDSYLGRIHPRAMKSMNKAKKPTSMEEFVLRRQGESTKPSDPTCASCGGPEPNIGGRWEGYCDHCINEGHALEHMREGALERKAEDKLDKAGWMGWISGGGTKGGRRIDRDMCPHCEGEGCPKCNDSGWKPEARGTYAETKPEAARGKPSPPTSMRLRGNAIKSLGGILGYIRGQKGYVLAKSKAKKSKPWKSRKGKAKVERTMHEWGQGELHSGSKTGPRVTSQKQAIAIALNQARKAVRKSMSPMPVVDAIAIVRDAIEKSKKPKLGSGKRFAAIKKKAAASGARNPGAVAAAAGRKKYGAKKMAALAAKGKKKKARKSLGGEFFTRELLGGTRLRKSFGTREYMDHMSMCKACKGAMDDCMHTGLKKNMGLMSTSGVGAGPMPNALF